MYWWQLLLGTKKSTSRSNRPEIKTWRTSSLLIKKSTENVVKLPKIAPCKETTVEVVGATAADVTRVL